MNIFSKSKDELESSNSIFTISEIYQQPNTWKKTLELVKVKKDKISAFVTNVTNSSDYEIIFTGAGTSEFIGNSLFSILEKQYDYKVKSIGTTDLIPYPKNYISKDKPTLLISFGRSGNSPESIGAVNALSLVNHNIYHLIITCNKNGELSKKEESENVLVINLPDETNDKSFAMTSSFSNMYLCAFLSLNISTLDKIENTLNDIIYKAQHILDNEYSLSYNIVNSFDFNRIVYLGNLSLKGISQESSLKMLELTAGDINTMFDTPMGFRHGPKSIINDSTLTVIYVSDDEYARLYEYDLIKEICREKSKNKVFVLGNNLDSQILNIVDYSYDYSLSSTLEPFYLGLLDIIFAQTLAVFKSLKMGITPDNPCPSGEVNRVVKGVTIYDYKEED